MVVTNLRLPGQYDERLLGSLGLQGPYYNWNRWYLPSVGRYLELDPIAKAGGMNGPYGPNWYGYAEGNPLRFTDRYGLSSLDEYKNLLRGNVAEWILSKIVDWTWGSATGAVCVQSACSAGSPREYFEAYGDCVAILGRIDLPPMVGEGDLFVGACASFCRDVTKSPEFKTHCTSRSCKGW